jgi:hypothetical protein
VTSSSGETSSAVARRAEGRASRPRASTRRSTTIRPIVAELIERSQAALAELKRDIRDKAGTELLDFIRRGHRAICGSSCSAHRSWA